MLELDDDYIIVGVSKCGTTSAHKFFTKRGYSMEKCDGWFHLKDYIDDFGLSHATQNKIPIIILRDPVERAWSHYHYMFQNKPVDETETELKRSRLEQVARKSYYKPWIDAWTKRAHDLGIEPVILYYEDLLAVEGFPHENETKVKPEMTDMHRELIESYIALEELDPTITMDIVNYI